MTVIVDEMNAQVLNVTDEEKRMGVKSCHVVHWGRTTIAKIETVDHYEAVGLYTVGRYNNTYPIRTTMARGNALQRLQASLDRRQPRSTEPRAVS